MPTWAVILIVVVVAAVVVVAVSMAMRQRRTTALRQKFGPEYDRTVETREDRRAAEAELRSRQQQRAQLDLRPLPAASRARYTEEWRQVQERFVDQPAEAVGAADGLLYRVMAERGYPMQDFSAQSDLISVDHPDVVENYRVAHRIQQQANVQQASTEDLREAMLRYRSLFEELLRADADEAAAVSPGRSRPETVTKDGSQVVGGAGPQPGTGEDPADQSRVPDESLTAQSGPEPRVPRQNATGWEASDEAR